MNKLSALAGFAAGAVVMFGLFTAVNTLIFLPNARAQGRQMLQAEQAVEAQKQELGRKRDDAYLQKLSDYDLCIGYLGRMSKGCEAFLLQPVR